MAYKPITDQQLRLYMTDLQNHSQRTAAARAGFSERTARRFDAHSTPPSKRKIVHGRTVADPLEGYWENELLPLLENDSALQAITLLRHLQSEHPVVFPDDRIRRTLAVLLPPFRWQRTVSPLGWRHLDVIFSRHVRSVSAGMRLAGHQPTNRFPQRPGRSDR